MTREEEIRKSAFEYIKSDAVKAGDEYTSFGDFINGAVWADAHPHWISVEDEMPKDGQYVATINTVGVKDVRHYSHGKWYSNFGNEYDDITHWMHLPQPPKEGGEK